MALLNSSLNAVLAIRDGYAYARWNFLFAGGTNDANPGGLGQAVSLTYAFASDIPVYATDSELSAGAFSVAQSAAAETAMAAIAEVARVSFSSAASASEADLAFRTCPQDPNTAAYAYYPSFNYEIDQNDDIVPGSIAPEDLAGDLWLNSNAYGPADSFLPGSDGYETLLHELGHALGLKHPFEAGSFEGDILPVALDDTRHTVMSYTAGARMTLLEVTVEGDGYSYITYDLSPRSLMPLDIAALQLLYGANTATRAGNTTYQWTPGEVFMETIWDGGGIDTIDCSNQSLRCVIDLTAGNYSSIGLRETTAQLRQSFKVPAFFPSADLPEDLYDGSDNLAIAYKVTIENASGGAGNDLLIGNSALNTLTGGAGNDTYVVQNAGDLVLEQAGQGTDLVQVRCAYTLPANVENGSIIVGTNINLFGNAGANTLIAGAGANTLDGKGGIDIVSYETATKAVKVSLATASTQDTLGSGLDLLTSIEGLIGSPFGDTLTGAGNANRLLGGAGADTLAGGGGSDMLVGGLGNDRLSGGAGLDVFRLDTKPGATSNRDTLVDFNVTDDTIELENSIFTALTITGTLATGSLRKGAGIQTAADANDFLIYNTNTGALFYDSDGTGAASAVQLVVLTGVPNLTNADFTIT